MIYSEEFMIFHEKAVERLYVDSTLKYKVEAYHKYTLCSDRI